MRDIFRKSRKAWFALVSESKLTGTPNQIEWAEKIRLTVAEEFDRVAKVFQAQVSIQTGQKQADTRTIIAILDEKRAETLSIPSAGYFIREWRELNDQVRQLIANDSRYRFIRDQRAVRPRGGCLTTLSKRKLATHEHSTSV